MCALCFTLSAECKGRAGVMTRILLCYLCELIYIALSSSDYNAK
jgi:hypothetical protein